MASFWSPTLTFFKDIFISCNKWKSKDFIIKNCQNSNASENIKKFFSWLNLPWSWWLKSLLCNNLLKLAVWFFFIIYWTLNIRVNIQRMLGFLEFLFCGSRFDKMAKKNVQQVLRNWCKEEISIFKIIADLIMKNIFLWSRRRFNFYSSQK